MSDKEFKRDDSIHKVAGGDGSVRPKESEAPPKRKAPDEVLKNLGKLEEVVPLDGIPK